MSRPFFDRAYRASLLVYPRAFRRRYGNEMLAFARERIDAAHDRGKLAAAREMLSLIADLLASAPRNWVLRSPHGIDLPPSSLPAYPRDHMDTLLQDLRFAIRGLVQRPAFTLVAVVTLALGIGANTAIFSVVDAVLIRPLPYPDPNQLVLIWGSQGAQKQQGVVFADYLDWRARNRSFSDMGVLRGQSVNLTGGDRPDRLIGSFVTASFFRVIGARVSQGRLFSDAETEVATRAPVAVLSYEAWRDRFGGDAAILGKKLTVNGVQFTVVGVTTPNMPVPLGQPDISLPIGYFPNAKGFNRGERQMAVAARLKPGVTLDAARKDLAAISAQLAQEYPTTNAGTGADIIALKEYLVARVRESLYIILAAVAVVLLIACANVANLQLARGASRGRELSVRAALGAGRTRIAQQLLTENVVLSLVGGVAGLALAFGLKQVLVALVGPQLPVDATDVRINAGVLCFALGVSIVTGLVFGIAPAWQASRADLNDMLRSRVRGGHASAATRNTLVVVQLALSLALLASAGLLTRSLLALQRVNPGFDGDRLLTAQFRLPPNKYDSPAKISAMFDRTVAELRATPEVESAALVRASPLSQNGESYPITIEGKPPVKPGDAPQMLVNRITPGYFSTMRIPLLLGRDVAEADRAGSLPVIVVNKTFADATWPHESPLGKRIKFGDDDWRTIVGVVGDTKHFTLNEDQLLQGYLPHAQRPEIFTSIVVRTRSANPLDAAKVVREAIWRVDRDQPIWRFRDMRQDLDGVVSSKKTMMWLTGLFAIVALLVAVVGIYGVLSYTMSQRTQELGIRIALGASARDVTRMVILGGAKLVGIAVFAGLITALGAARLLRNQLFGVAANDFVTFAVVTAVLAGVAILACYLPARRASRVDPMVALRSD